MYNQKRIIAFEKLYVKVYPIMKENDDPFSEGQQELNIR